MKKGFLVSKHSRYLGITRGVEFHTRDTTTHFVNWPMEIRDKKERHRKSHPLGLPWWLRQWRICLQSGRPRFDPWIGKIPWRRGWQSTPVFLPGESPWTEEPRGHKEWNMTERLRTHINEIMQYLSLHV